MSESPAVSDPALTMFLARCDAYLAARPECGLRPWTEGHLSARLLGNGHSLQAWRRGARRYFPDTLARAAQRLDGLEEGLRHACHNNAQSGPNCPQGGAGGANTEA